MVLTWLKDVCGHSGAGALAPVSAKLCIDSLETRDVPSGTPAWVNISVPDGMKGQPAYVVGHDLPITVTTNSDFTGNVTVTDWQGLETPVWDGSGHQMNNLVFHIVNGATASMTDNGTTFTPDANGAVHGQLTYAGYTQLVAGVGPNSYSAVLDAQPWRLVLGTNNPVNSANGYTQATVNNYLDLTVTAFNADGTIATGYDGTINLKSNNEGALSADASNLGPTADNGGYDYHMTKGVLTNVWLLPQQTASLVLLVAKTEWAGSVVGATANSVAVQVNPVSPPVSGAEDYLVLLQGTYTNAAGVPIPVKALEPLMNTTTTTPNADARKQLKASLQAEFGTGTLTLTVNEVKWSGPASGGFPSDMTSNPAYWQV